MYWWLLVIVLGVIVFPLLISFGSGGIREMDDEEKKDVEQESIQKLKEALVEPPKTQEEIDEENEFYEHK